MNKLINLYRDLRIKDKKLISTIPIDNRIILSKLETNSSADCELKYAWLNRATTQVSKNKTSAILGLSDCDSKEHKVSRRMTLKYREEENLPIPFEINSSKDFEIFMNNINQNFIIIKQNYPNYKNEEFLRLKKYNFKNKKIIYANIEKSNIVIGSNESLEKICAKDTKWLSNKIEEYLIYFYNKNDIKFIKEDYDFSLKTMIKLVNSILIKSELYKGDISNLRNRIKNLLSNNILPVLKFSDSISGYGVHYPKNNDGKYNRDEIEEVIENDICFEKYLVSVFCKNGQTINKDNLLKKIEENGIILQKYIEGNDYAIGFFKPLEMYAQQFSLGLIDLDISEVLTNGTAHYGDILHYEEEFIHNILKNTFFKGQSELLYFSIEILLFLICVNEGIVNKPEELINFNIEDFGIQFMVNDKTGEIGLIEINARTPSHNFNHFNLLSVYGREFWNSYLLPSKKILCSSAKIIVISELYKIIKNEEDENKLIHFLKTKMSNNYNKRCQLISFQVLDNFFTVYYNYFIEDNNFSYDIIKKIEIFFKESISSFINN